MDEIFQGFGLGRSGGGRRDNGADSISVLSNLVFVKTSLLSQVFGLPAWRPGGISSDSCTPGERSKERGRNVKAFQRCLLGWVLQKQFSL